MPVKLSLGLTKKLGLPAYSSAGASCHLECELETAALESDAGHFHEEAQRLFALCRQAVEEQLAREVAAAHPTGPWANGQTLCCVPPENNVPENLSGDVDQAPGRNGDSLVDSEPSLDWGLSPRQLAFLQDLAGQIQGLGLRRLPALVALQYDKNLAELTSVEASRLISLLRQVCSGRVPLRTLLEDSPSER